VVGTVDEDFAVECNAGDVFLLGNTSWRTKHVRGGEVVVTSAPGAPATVPFWLGEAPGRSVELSRKSADCARSSGRISAGARPNDEVIMANADWPRRPRRRGAALAYVAGAGRGDGDGADSKEAALRTLFDESGGMHLVIHAPFGSRINRAWGWRCASASADVRLRIAGRGR